MTTTTESTHSSDVPDPAAALEKIVADEEVDPELLQWAADELLAGREPGELVAELVGLGRQESAAERAVEMARRQTREQRGVMTRDAVVRDLNVDYRRNTAGMSVAFCTGLFGIYGFTKRVMTAWRTLRKLSRVRSDQR